MKMVLIIILAAIVYFFISILTWGILCLIDRLNGESAETVYKNEEEYIPIALFWPIMLPLLLGYLIWRTMKKWVIAAVETIVAVARKEESKDG